MSTQASPPTFHEQDVREICARHDNRPDALIEILHTLQDSLGHVPEAGIPVIADALNLSRADVHGVVSFYHDFHRAPTGRHRLKICCAEACQSVQGDALARQAEERLGIRFGETSDDGSVTLEAAYCLGNCALGPSVMLDDQLLGRVQAEQLDELIRECGEESP